MKTSNRMAPAYLFLLGIFALFAAAYFSPVGQSMAEGGIRAAEATSFQADAEAAQSSACEDVEVEADEGYGVSHKVFRRLCH